MNIFYFHRGIAVFLFAVIISSSVSAQVQNPDAITLFNRSAVGGTAATAGAGGAFSSVGGDLGSMDLNPAGLGLFTTSDISITPGIRIAADQSSYNGSSMSTNHTLPEFAQAGAVFTKKFSKYSPNGAGTFALKSITFGINYQVDNSFDRNQSFNYLNNSGSLIDNYAKLSNEYGSAQWSIESALFAAVGILGQNALGQYTSNVKAPVYQTGLLTTRGETDRISLGLGGNLGDKLFFGFSLGIPILNYTVNAQISETNANPNDSITHFQNYQLSSVVDESGVGVTGKIGLIYKPVSWFRIGMSYSLPTWYFMNENYSGNLNFAFDTIPPSTTGELDANPVSYRIRTPMRGTLGASFYLNENTFLSVDYELQNMGSTHYSFPSDSLGQGSAYNNYIKGTYTYSHTLRAGIQGAIKKLRLRAGYSYSSSPFKSGQNYTAAQYNQAIQGATLGLGLRFKVFYIDLAYMFSYTKDGVSSGYVIPLDQINSTLMTHSVLLTLGFKIPAKGDKGAAPAKQRSSDRLPKYIDPGDKY
jgi:hypothetical protein